MVIIPACHVGDESSILSRVAKLSEYSSVCVEYTVWGGGAGRSNRPTRTIMPV